MWMNLAEGILEDFADHATGEVRWLEERLSVRARRRFVAKAPRKSPRRINMDEVRALTKARRGGRRCARSTTT